MRARGIDISHYQQSFTFKNNIDFIVIKATEEMREKLVSKGMIMRRPDKKKFIEAAMKVQDSFAGDKGKEFKEIVLKIREAAK